MFNLLDNIASQINFDLVNKCIIHRHNIHSYAVKMFDQSLPDDHDDFSAKRFSDIVDKFSPQIWERVKTLADLHKLQSEIDNANNPDLLAADSDVSFGLNDEINLETTSSLHKESRRWVIFLILL